MCAPDVSEKYELQKKGGGGGQQTGEIMMQAQDEALTGFWRCFLHPPQVTLDAFENLRWL